MMWKLYLITKLQNLKAIHNPVFKGATEQRVVSNYKITKSESYSQHCKTKRQSATRCI